MSELFLVLTDSFVASEPSGAQPPARGQKHRLDEDQMSVQSVESKRPDVTTSAEKNKAKKNQPQSQKNQSKSKSQK